MCETFSFDLIRNTTGIKYIFNDEKKKKENSHFNSNPHNSVVNRDLPVQYGFDTCFHFLISPQIREFNI